MKREDLKKYNSPLVAQMYALVSWYGKTLDEAKNMVDKEVSLCGDAVKAFKELDKTTYAYDSIKSAHDGIKAHNKILQNGSTSQKYDAIINILVDIHNKWVETNGKKINRGSQEKSEKMLFQHLPLELIGIDEVCKDAMFLAPFLDNLNIDIGTMQNDAYGAFIPSQELKDAYNKKVEKFKSDYKINSKDDLKNKMESIIKDYTPLHAKSEYKNARLKYMLERTDLLTNSVASKHNKNMFEKVAEL